RCGSTLRQFVEVWRLTDSTPPGSPVLPVLRAALLHAEGGAAEVNADGARRELAVVHGARMALEKVFGDDRMVTLKWYETGLVRSRSVARLDRMNGKGYGTGWLVQSRDFFPEQPPRV